MGNCLVNNETLATRNTSQSTTSVVEDYEDGEAPEEFKQDCHQVQRQAVYGGGGDDESDYEEKRDTKKSQEEIVFIDGCCKDKVIFTNMDKEQRAAIIEQMYRMQVSKGTEIIVQGDTTKKFYVVMKGSFDITINGDSVASSEKGDTVGELALLYDSPRAATVVAKEDSELFVMHRSAYKTKIRNREKDKSAKIKAVLKNNKVFSQFPDEILNQLEAAFVDKDFVEGETIMLQGKEEDELRFYLIKSGVCEWSKKLPSGETESGDLKLGDYFGERALIKEEKRAATVTAKNAVKTLALSKEDFNEIIKDRDVFRKRMTSYDSKEQLEVVKKVDVCDLEDLLMNTIGVLGKGAFGTVTLVVDTKNNKSYALKAVKKCQIVKMRQQKHVIVEMKVMRQLATYNCPFLANLIRTYKDTLRVYYLLEVCLGGELFTILRKRRQFSEKIARFYVACVIEAFDCMHSHNIIYRDLKPENLVLDDTGYAKVTDFGFAKVVTDKTFTLCGTPDYLAPEIVTGTGHGKAVDWWTLGILTYEMIASYPPFYSKSPMITYKKILKGKPKFTSSFSDPAKRFVVSFLKTRPVKRLGMQLNGVEIMRNRSFFKNFDWPKLKARTMQAPIRNKVRNLKDMSNFQRSRAKKDDATPVRKEDDFDEDF